MITPAELNILIEDYVEKHKEHTKEIITLAYYTAAFQRVKKLPKLSKLLKSIDKQNRNRMTDEELLRAVEAANTALGGNVLT